MSAKIEKIFAAGRLDTKIHSDSTTKKEKWLGYFLGPCLTAMVYSGVGGTYLTQFYTDVLGLSGVFLTLMPFLSKAVDVIMNLLIGRLIDHTRTRQGKARPWLLISGGLIAVAGCLLYAVPRASVAVQMAWIVVSYNLFFAFAYSIYNLSHALMVPLSTRDTKQRDTLAMFTSTGTSMIPGTLVTVIMPLLVPLLGVGAGAQGHWMAVMSVISILALPAVLMEYYFTKERVTEERQDQEEGETVSFARQMKACFFNRYWLLIMGMNVLTNLFNQLSNRSMVYYCNWVLGNSVDSGALNQIMVNVIGQAPLGFGVFLLWPLVRKFGKRRVTLAGYLIGAAGCLMVLLHPGNMGFVLGGLFIKSIGSLPTYVMTAMLAETLDYIEWKNDFRVDGFSASMMSILMTIAQGLGQSILLGGINLFGYIAPEAADQVIVQPEAVQTFFNWCFVGGGLISLLGGALAMIFFDVEKKMPKVLEDMEKRKQIRYNDSQEGEGKTFPEQADDQ